VIKSFWITYLLQSADMCYELGILTFLVLGSKARMACSFQRVSAVLLIILEI
jgi:hypothetical protein